jgi:hypothetical protein
MDASLSNYREEESQQVLTMSEAWTNRDCRFGEKPKSNPSAILHSSFFEEREPPRFFQLCKVHRDVGMVISSAVIAQTRLFMADSLCQWRRFLW